MQPIDDTDFGGLTLEQRTVQFFTVITEGLPIVGENPLMRALMHRLGPLLVKELEGLSRDELQRVYQGMFVALGQVYNPKAAAIVIDLRQQHVLTQEVEIAVGQLSESADTALEIEALPVRAHLESNALTAHLEEPDEVLAPPPPAPPLPVLADEDDVMIGVELPDGTVVAMRISERDALLRQAL